MRGDGINNYRFICFSLLPPLTPTGVCVVRRKATLVHLLDNLQFFCFCFDPSSLGLFCFKEAKEANRLFLALSLSFLFVSDVPTLSFASSHHQSVGVDNGKSSLRGSAATRTPLVSRWAEHASGRLRLRVQRMIGGRAIVDHDLSFLQLAIQVGDLHLLQQDRSLRLGFDLQNADVGSGESSNGVASA